MGTIYVFMADGFEDIEALATVDVLRRGGLEVNMVSVNGTTTVRSAHGVTVGCDARFEDLAFDDAAMLVLPGGMSPGAQVLNEHEGLRALLLKADKAGLPMAAICAAPYVLGGLGLLKGRRATCYPGFESYLQGAVYTAAQVEQDGRFITGNGPGAALPFAFALLEFCCGKEKTEEIRSGMMAR